MLKQPISITGFSSISALGNTQEEIWKKYLDTKPLISYQNFNGIETPVSKLAVAQNETLEKIREENSNYKNLDRSVLLALAASRHCIKEAGWYNTVNFGVNIGSSRGATELFERYHQEFLQQKLASTLSSPTTTLGNISSWVAQDLQSAGPDISHSITCSTALHAVLNGIAWLQSDLCDKFLVGGSEAPLTAFTIAQMKALKIYASKNNTDYPCRALDLDKNKNTMFLGEGAGMVCLEKGKNNKAKALITGIGYATEPLKHHISISTEATCFQKSIKMALKDKTLSEIDAVVMHAPGTIKGDLSEYNAIKQVFGSNLPALTTNKWKIGHTFGASGILSLELAILMLQNQKIIPVPFLENQKLPKKLERILVNAVGFGGNAVSVLVERV
ncbi:beta-ketoacyl synthase [Aquimarina sp. ERC-38]|uniref:beta-ketoacyl synthase N-terminal-like domain-containing protein n=1 Tax=Aquimarina sp. ERC-38 TaxID=2949996 RepID=UPI0022473D7C|nr:beta-ketoacyl synthase N-terminal-like domain-containing protein [Aquimarina sp. ERC-38]UZO82645.1 beta-ketoacyl synthase [Aquimarina sp. ERC-38]